MKTILFLHCAVLAVTSPAFIDLTVPKDWVRINISDFGFDMSTLMSLVFQVKACSLARLQLYPLNNSAPFYRFVVNAISDPISPIGRHKKCSRIDDKVDCFESENLTLEPCCDKYKTYWTMIEKDGNVMVGEGDVPGGDILNVLHNDGPFNLGEVVLQSQQTSYWKILQEQIDDTKQDPNSVTMTSTSQPSISPITTTPKDPSVVTSETTMTGSSVTTPAGSGATTASSYFVSIIVVPFWLGSY